MKKFLTLALVGAVALGASSVVFANICAFDPVPAATLLFPFVEMDYNGSTTTTFAITNVSSEAQIVHVTLWTDYSKPILDFNVLLTGYDVQTFNIADILKNGDLPQTGGTYSNVGTTPDADGPVSGANGKTWVENLLAPPESTSVLAGACTEGNPGGYGPGIINAGVLASFQAALTASNLNTRTHSLNCTTAATTYEPNWWDDVAFNAARPTWMYITADVVEFCNTEFPNTANFWGTLAGFDNVLIGDWYTINPDTNDATAMQAVHIEADMDLDSVVRELAPGWPTTFYSRYNASGIDYREPLGTAWAGRYAVAPGFDTKIRAFKGSTLFATIYDLDVTADASVLTADYCDAYTYYSWDEEENVFSGTAGSGPYSGGEDQIAPNLLPLETQEVDLTEFHIADDFGWILFVWPASNYDIPGADPVPDYYQTWMGFHYTADGPNGLLSEGMNATLMANYNCFSDQVLPNLGINYDYVGPNGYMVPAGNAAPLK